MKQIATMRVTQATARFGEHAPMATVCCNACRTCVQANLIGIALGALAASVTGMRRLVPR